MIIADKSTIKKILCNLDFDKVDKKFFQSIDNSNVFYAILHSLSTRNTSRESDQESR